MSIRKQLREALLNESMSAHIKGYDYQNTLDNVSDIQWYLKRKVGDYLIDLIGEDKFREYRTYSFFELDGDTSPFDEMGTINFYIWEMPGELVKHVCGYIIDLMHDKGVVIMPNKVEQSGSMRSKVVRLDVHSNKNAGEGPPKFSLSNYNAKYFFTEIMRYSKKEFQYGEFAVKDLMTRIDFALKNLDLTDYDDTPQTKKVGNITHHYQGYNQDDVKRRLEVLKELCLYAKEHGYNTILVN